LQVGTLAENNLQEGSRTASWLRLPSIYYGWFVVGALAITEPISWGILYYGFGVMLTPIQQEMGWSQTESTGAFSLMLLVSGVMAVPVGRWLDQHGARGLMTVGSCLATVAIVAWAQIQTLLGFYLVWVGVGMISAMILYEPAFAVTATWFVRRRSQALTLLTLGGGLASVIFVPFATWLVQLYGWCTTLWILAGILAVTTIPLHALVLQRSPESLNVYPDGDPPPKVESPQKEAANYGHIAPPGRQPSMIATGISVRVALRQSAFWWLSTAFALSTLSSVALAVHLIPFLINQGYQGSFAALTVSVLGGSQIPGRLLFGPLSSRLSLRLITAFLFGMMTIGLLILLGAPNPGLVLLGAGLFGMGSGASSPARAGLVGEFYGITNYGTINGVMTLVLTVARSGAPVAMGILYTWTGGYGAVFWVLILSAATAVAAILAAQRERHWTLDIG
jgi:MFS family permease